MLFSTLNIFAQIDRFKMYDKGFNKDTIAPEEDTVYVYSNVDSKYNFYEEFPEYYSSDKGESLIKSKKKFIYSINNDEYENGYSEGKKRSENNNDNIEMCCIFDPIYKMNQGLPSNDSIMQNEKSGIYKEGYEKGFKKSQNEKYSTAIILDGIAYVFIMIFLWNVLF